MHNISHTLTIIQAVSQPQLHYLEEQMRTTLDIPKDLIDEAMSITHARTKTELIKLALTNIIDQNKRNKLINYHGRLNLDIDLDQLRKR